MAHSRISERKISQYAQAKQLQSYAQQQEQQAQNARNDSTISRIGQTLGDFFGNLAGGVVGAVEGIIDFGATVVGGIGGLFDDDFKGEVQDFVSYNWTQDKVINPILEGTQGSYINDASENVRNIVRGVASGVGQMLPAVAVTVATGGLGAPAAFAQGAGLATIGLGAAGGGVQEAFQEGADYGEALGYGILSGGLEVAIEKLSGGLGKQFIGKGLTDDLIKNVARKVTTNQAAQKGLRILMEAGGEAAEEWTSEFLNPYLKRMTYDSDAELSTRESRLEAALIGGLTSLAFRGTVGQINTHTQQASEALSELQTLEQKESKLWGDDKLTETKQKEIDDFRLETKQTLSEQLQKMSNKRRADFISSYKLEDMVNADGTLKGAQAQAESVVGETDGAQAQSIVEGEQTAQKVDYNRAAYSPALYGKESELRFAPTQSALTADEVKAKQYFSKLNRGKRNANLVFTDDMPDVGGAFARGAQDKNTVYINRKANAMEQVIVHEMTHFARGTKEYKKLQDFVLRESNQEFIDGLAQDISETYGIDLQELVQKSRNFDKLSAEEAEQFSKDYSEVLDEVVATYVSEHIFTDEKAINSLAEDNRSLVKRIYKWIKNKIEVLTKGKTKAERDAIKYLQKAEKLYANALESAVGVNLGKGVFVSEDENVRYSIRKKEPPKKTIIGYKVFFAKNGGLYPPMVANPGGEATPLGVWLDADSGVIAGTSATGRLKVKAGGKGTQGGGGTLAYRPGWHLGEYPKATQFNRVNPETGEKDLFPKDFVWAKCEIAADVDYQEEAMSYGYNENGKFIHSYAGLPKIPTDGYYKYRTNPNPETVPWYITGAMRVIEILDDNDVRAILKDFGQEPLERQGGDIDLSKYGLKHGIVDGINIKDVKKSDDIRYSLSEQKDSKGNTLTQAQAEFFKDSKIRDNNGNLQVMYHGSPSKFFTFDRNRMGKGNDQFGAGFYFATEKETARGYGENIYSTYLDVRNPIIINRTADGGDLFDVEITQNQAYKILKRHPLIYDSDNSPLGDLFDEFWKVGAKDYMIKQAASKLTSIGLLDSDYVAFRYYPNELHEAIRDVLGYDGIEVRFDNSQEKFVVAWFENQIKLTTNKKPTSSDDIRYSLVSKNDSEGKTLTDEQIEFFKDSKVRDENGNLKVLYHGTAADFTVFDLAESGASNDHTSHIGFWFTPRKAVAENFAEFNANEYRGKKARVQEVYLNIENPKIYAPADNSARMEELRTENIGLREQLAEEYAELKKTVGQLNYMLYFTEDNIFGRRGENNIGYRVEEDYYVQYMKMSPEQAKKAKFLVDSIKKNNKQIKANQTEYYRLQDGDSFLQMSDDLDEFMEWITGTHAHERGFGREHYAATNAREAAEKFRSKLIKEGYDGIWIKDTRVDDSGDQVVAFYPEQIKLVTNKRPTKDVDIRYALSPRQIAERTLPKKYTKSDAKRALDDIMGNLLYDNDSKAGEIKGKNKTAVLDMLYRSLNEAEVGKRINYADRIAEYIINNAAAVDLYEDETNYENIAVLNTTKDYLRKINLSDKGIRAEIESRYGKDYAKVIYSMWGARKGETGVGADVAYSEIVNELGFGQDINNEADAFFQIADWYVEARDALRKKANETLDATLRENERAEIKAEIVRNVLKSFEKYGEETQLYQLVKRYENRIAELKDLVTETKQYNRLLNKAIDSVAKISTLNNKDFAPASKLHDERFKPLISKLSKIKWRSELIRPATRDIIVEFGDTFYNASNPFLADAYQDEVANAIGYLRERKQYFEQEGIKAKPLDAEELRMLNIVTDNIYHVFKNYDTFIKDGKRESVTEYAKRGVDIVDKSAKNGGKDNFVSRVVKKGSTFIKNVVDPATVMKWGDGFYTENGKAAGVMFELYNAVRLSETQAKSKYIELITPLEDFFKKTKGYRKHYTTATVTIAGKEIPLGVAMSLSLTAKQNDVWGYTNLKGEYVENGLGTEGFGYVDKNGDFVTVGAVTKAQIAEMENQFTSEDKQYLGLVRDFFDKGTSPLLRETDMTRKGYTTVNKQNYFPTQRYEGGIAKDIIGMSQYQAMTSTLANPSFLKERKTGARGKYQIGDIFSIVQKHGVFSTCYAYMAMPLENFSRVYNKNVAENDAPVLSLKTEVNEKIWSGFDKYLTNLFGDISQSNKARDFGQNLLDKLMSNYAKFQLGFNPKTIVGQTSSYPMALIRLDMRALAYGLRKVNFKQLDKYCPYAKVRDYEGSIVRAQSMTDNIGKVGDALTKPIQKVDRLTCGLIFNACQWQVQKEQGFKIGTEENLIAAGKLAEEVIRDTQSNSVITEKSGLMRNKNMVVRWFTMFSSDAMKQVSRFVESVGEYNALRRRVKNGETGQDAYLKKMRDKIARTTTAILVSNLMFVLVGQFFKWLYDKDRIDKEGNEISVWEDLANDYIGQIIGLLPVARDIYSFLGEGYEVNGFIYGTINDLLGATDDIVKVVSKLAKGEVTDTPDFMLPLRNSIYAVGQLLGIPTRNIYNVFYGLTKRFSPESAYKVNSLFYDAYLTSDLNEAIEKGDDDLAQTIVGVIMDGEGMAEDEAIQRKIVELAKQGLSAIPRRLGDTITYNGEQIKLTNNQAKRFAEVYGGANNAVKQLLHNSGFDNLSPEVQAKSIKFVYDYYWQLALEDMLGEGLEEKKLLFATAIPIDKLAYIVSYCQSLESDKDRKGNTVSGSLKTKITTFVNRQQGLSAYQKYMVMAYLGYRSTTAESKIKAYVNRLDLTKSQRERLLEYCGY